MSNSATRYIALLRGINISGQKRMKMADLRAMMTSQGYSQVETALATGNIAFNAPSTDPADLETAIAQAIVKTFGFDVSVIVLPQTVIQEFIAADPFAEVVISDDTQLYVTFLPEAPDVSLELPYATETGDFTIIQLTDRFVCGYLTRANTRSTDAMRTLETLFGDAITTRNWNTVLRLEHL